MKWVRKGIIMGLLVTMILTIMAPAAYAATSISSVSVKVGLDIEAGECLPDISVGGTSGTYAYTNSSRYHVSKAEWVTSTDRVMSIGDRAKMKVWLVPDSTSSTEYAFRSSYGSGSVSISGGDYVSARRDDGELVVTLNTNPIKGRYQEPEEAYWRGNPTGMAKWSVYDKAESSNVFDVYLYRGSTLVKKLENTKSTQYNFYPYMTQKGTYKFKVRVVPYTENEKRSGKVSSWVTSDELYISADEVSDGSGQSFDDGSSTAGTTPSGGQTQVGWILEGNTWYFRYPDGSFQKNGWAKVNDKWYLFDSAGRMLTGWQNVGGYTFYLNPDGDMLTGWKQEGSAWYYLDPTRTRMEGALLKNAWIAYDNRTYYVNEQGVMAEGWNQVAGQWYYFYPGDGRKAVNTTIDGFYVDGNGIWHH